jgi:hypothetical protein
MEIVAETVFDLIDSSQKVHLRVGKPYKNASSVWECLIEIDEPIAVSLPVYGESSLQALILAIRAAASYLYSSDLYKSGKLGIYGVFGADLSIPAPAIFLDDAPYPF